MIVRSYFARRAWLIPLALVGVGGCPDSTVIEDPDTGLPRSVIENDGYGPRPKATVVAGANGGALRTLSDELTRHGTSTVIAGTTTTNSLGATSGGAAALPTLDRPAGTRAYMTGSEPVGNIADTLLCSNVGSPAEAGSGDETLFTASTGTNAAIFAQSFESATNQADVTQVRQSELPYSLGVGVETFENGTAGAFSVPGFGVVPSVLFEVALPGESITISDNLNFVEGFPLSYTTTVTVDQAIRTEDGCYVVARIATQGTSGKMEFSVSGTHEFCVVAQPGKLRYASRTEYAGTMGVPTSSDGSLFWNVAQTIIAHGLLD